MRKRSTITIGLSEHDILLAFHRYYYLTARQLCRLLFSPGSLTYVQTKLKALADASYLQRIFLPRTEQRGSAPSIYTLSRSGHAYLRSVGEDIPVRAKPYAEREHSYLFLAHTLCVNDFFIGLDLLCGRMPQLSVHTLLHERALKHQPSYVEVSPDGKVAVIPDGWVDLRIQMDERSEQMCLALEIDRGTIEQKRWRRRIRALVAWSQGPYQKQFGTQSLTIAIVAVPGQKRLTELLRWTEAELEAAGQKAEADLFCFTATTPAEDDPAHFFLRPCWIQPFETRAIPLLDGLS